VHACGAHGGPEYDPNTFRYPGGSCLVGRKEHEMSSSRNLFRWTSRLLLTGLWTISFLALAGPARGQNHNDLQDLGGPVMQAPKVFLIFWLPPGNHFDPAGASADTGYENLIQQFFTDISAGNYLNIVSQYPGTCGLPNLPASQPCFGAVSVGGTLVDTRPYPHAGTATDPLQDSDIQAEITNVVTSQGLTPGLGTEFFVFTGANVNECSGFGCTGNPFCTYHGDFQLNGNTVIYAVMRDVNSISCCEEGISTSPNQLSADREIVAASNALSESI